jgi:hypothetical protein
MYGAIGRSHERPPASGGERLGCGGQPLLGPRRTCLLGIVSAQASRHGDGLPVWERLLSAQLPVVLCLPGFRGAAPIAVDLVGRAGLGRCPGIHTERRICRGEVHAAEHSVRLTAINRARIEGRLSENRPGEPLELWPATSADDGARLIALAGERGTMLVPWLHAFTVLAAVTRGATYRDFRSVLIHKRVIDSFVSADPSRTSRLRFSVLSWNLELDAAIWLLNGPNSIWQSIAAQIWTTCVYSGRTTGLR